MRSHLFSVASAIWFQIGLMVPVHADEAPSAPVQPVQATDSADAGAATAGLVTYKLRIGLYAPGALSTEEVQGLVDRMNQFVHDPHRCPQIRFELDGAPSPYPQSLPIVIAGHSDLDLLKSAGFSLYIVEGITWCTISAPSGLYIAGCAREHGPVTTV